MTLPEQKNIWIIEDDSGCRFVYKDILATNYNLSFFSSIGSFLESWVAPEMMKPNLLLVDLRLEDGFFMDLIGQGSQILDSKIPFVVVSVVDDVEILRLCFRKGAIDYLTKPFNKAELAVKVERVLRTPVGETLEKSMDFRLDPFQMVVSIASKASKELTAKEFKILSLFLATPDGRLTKESIYNSIWCRTKVSVKTIDVHLSNLRKKINKVGLRITFHAPFYVLESLHETREEPLLKANI